MKKKSPPYAIIAAFVVGIVTIALFIQWKKGEDQKTAQLLADQQAALQAKIDALNANKAVPVVVPTPVNMRDVLYATQPVAPGTRISPAFFEVKPTPKDILPDAYSDQAEVIGLVATRNIEKGDPLTPRNTGKTIPYISQRIPVGMRVIELPVFDASTNNTGGFVVDGDKVDLLFTTSSTDNQFIVKTEMIMQNLDVLFVPGPSIKSDYTEAVNPVPAPGVQIAVTFLVTPEQAQALVFLSQVKNGKFSMILRSRKDNTELKIKAFAAEDYPDGFKKVQALDDKAAKRVKELSDQIAAEEKKQGSGNTNETPTPPSP